MEMCTAAHDAFMRHLKIVRLNGHHLQNIDEIKEAARIFLNVQLEANLLGESSKTTNEVYALERIFLEQEYAIGRFSHILADFRNSEISGQPITGKDEYNLETKRQMAQNTQYTAQNILQEITTRMNRFRGISGSAIRVSEEVIESYKTPSSLNYFRVINFLLICVKYSQVKTLLSLKEQQANSIKSRISLLRTNQSIAQSQLFNTFTIITVIFLPLTFLSSVFGMNSGDFLGSDNKGRMSLSYQFIFVCELEIYPYLLHSFLKKESVY